MSDIKQINLKFDVTNTEFKIVLDLDFPNQKNLYTYLENKIIVDPPMIQTILECVEENTIYIDVGSHIGYLSLIARQKIGSRGYVYCFEPNPQSYKALVRNVVINNYSNIFCFNCALAENESVSSLSIIQYDEGLSTLGNVENINTLENKHMYENKSKIDVFVSNLDTIMNNINHDISLLKIDVESFEEQVILGAKEIINKKLPKNIIFEINKAVPNHNPSQLQNILSILEPLGYKSYIIHPWPSSDEAKNYFDGHNYLPLSNFSNNQNIVFANILMKKENVV